MEFQNGCKGQDRLTVGGISIAMASENQITPLREGEGQRLGSNVAGDDDCTCFHSRPARPKAPHPS